MDKNEENEFQSLLRSSTPTLNMTFSWFTTNASETISPVSWIADGVALRCSRIHGAGLFATKDFTPDEVVIVLGGTIFSVDEVRRGKALDQSTTGYGEGLYVGKPIVKKDQSPFLDDYLNHSCNPNLWLKGRLTIVTRRGILAGEEITIDYSTWEIEESWKLPGQCNCGSHICRGKVTGRDWRSRQFQHQYNGHLLPCLVDRILNRSNPGKLLSRSRVPRDSWGL
jgi:hypothetical protein